jgi:hypothetical protein
VSEDYNDPAKLLRFTASSLMETGYLILSLAGVRLAHGRAVVPLVIALALVYLIYSGLPPVVLYFRARRSESGEPES